MASAGVQGLADTVDRTFAALRSRREAEAEQVEAQRRQKAWADALEDMKLTNSANLAEKQALRLALAALDPKHALLSNTVLQEKVREAGRRAFALTRNFDAAREAGSTFNVT